MILIKRIQRVRAIVAVCRQYRLYEFLPNKSFPLRLILLLIAPFVKQCSNQLSEGERLRLALTKLGPIFIKFGQLLSTRRDLLPEAIADVLALLQDQVEPFASKTAIQIIEKNMGSKIEALFTTFDSKALASASVAQVHSAELKDGAKVVVKILRPNIEQIIQSDLTLMAGIANFLEQYIPSSRRFRPVEVVDDYQQTILNELDLRLEAENTKRLRKNWLDSDLLYVPEIYPEMSYKNVMVMERIYGVPISDISTLQESGTDMQELAERGVEIFFTQVFRDSFFHADMHPGNIFVDISNPLKPKYIAIDCGIMGTLTKDDQRYLAKNFLAFFNRDYKMVAKLHLESGWIPPGTQQEAFEASIKSVCEPIFGKPLSEISFGDFLLNLFQTARKFNMPVQPQLVLLQKTLLYVEGLGRQLYPQLDLWQTAKPYLENWLKHRMSPSALFEEIKQRAPYWREKFPELPDLLFTALKNDEQKHRLLEHQIVLLERQLKLQEKRFKSLIFSIFGIASLVTGIFYVVPSPQTMTQTLPIDLILIALGSVLIIIGLIAALKNVNE